ncbi:MAG: hypothetical protein L0Z50_35000, partial [Verrucomicrobiales bacterium]|nr:hypothetical protein [Verrucomicrobiales bacterium]
QPRGLGAVRLVGPNGISDFHWILFDPLPTATNVETNKTVPAAQKLVIPSAVDGIAAEITSHFFRCMLKKGKRVAIEVVAARLGSAMDPVLRVLDSAGREQAYNEDSPALGTDARIDFTAAKSGQYTIELRDTRYQGGPRFFYRLRVADSIESKLPFIAGQASDLTSAEASKVPAQRELEPNNSLQTAQPIDWPCSIAGGFGKPRDRDFYAFTVEKDQRLIVRGKTRSLGWPCDLFLQIQKPDGSKVAEANPTGADEGGITNKFAEGGAYRLLVEELNHQGGTDFNYQIVVQPFQAGFALTAETNKLQAPASGAFDLKVTAARREYDGPITLKLSHPGLTFTNNLIPAKTNLAQLKVSVPPDWPPGKLINFSVSGEAKIGEALVEARASTSPALRKSFPNLLYPPPALDELDGLIGLGIIEGKPKPDSASKQTADKK